MPSFAEPSTAAMRAVLADLLFRQVAQLLAAAGIPVAPLKGVLWQKTLYAGEEHLRPLMDVDVLVPRHHFANAQRALLEAEMRPLTSRLDPRERTFLEARIPLHLDLHCMLFPPGRYRMHTVGLFSRAHPDQSLFGERVWILDPADQLLHLLGHFVCSHMPATAKDREDLRRLLNRSEPDPATLARRAEEAGMIRTLLLALPSLVTAEHRPWLRRVRDALTESATDTIFAETARALLRRASPNSKTATVASYLCARSLPSAVLSLLGAAVNKRAQSLERA